MSEYLAHEAAFRGEGIIKNREGKKITICGVGALGSWLTDLLVRQGYQKLKVIDFDKVERKNSGTQIYGQDDIGRSKAVQLRGHIYRRLGITIEAVAERLRATNVKKLLSGSDLVVDVFDDVTSRRLVVDFCLQNGIPCVHAGMASVGYFEIVWNSQYKVPNEPEKNDTDEPCEYPLASNLVLLCVATLAEVINRHFDSNENHGGDAWVKTMQINLKKQS